MLPWTLFRWWKLRPHTWSLERSTRWLNFPWKFFNSLNIQTSFREVVALGLGRIRWMRSSPNAWAAAKIGCRDLKKSRKAETPRGQESMPSSTAQRVFFMPTEEFFHPTGRSTTIVWLEFQCAPMGKAVSGAGGHCDTKESLPLLCQVTAEANLRNSPCVRSKNWWHELHAWKSSFILSECITLWNFSPVD